jgi:thiol-disulfide isomerase/thioredoxin
MPAVEQRREQLPRAPAVARSRPALVTAALSAAAVVAYLGYRAYDSQIRVAEDTAAEAAAESTLAAVLPEFALGNLAGESQSIRSWPGKPLVINFWATWCGPCLREIPMLKELQTARPDVQVVGIAIDKRDPVVEFAGRTDFNYAILVGQSQSEAWAAAAALGVNIYALPFTVFTGADGSILGVHTGELHAEHLDRFRAVVDELAAGKITVEVARERLAEPI